MRNSAEAAKEGNWFLAPLTREGKRFQFSAPCPCLIAQHEISLQMRNCLCLAGSKSGSSPTTLSIFLSGVCWIFKQGSRLLMDLHLRTNLSSQTRSRGDPSPAEALPLAPREPAQHLSLHGHFPAYSFSHSFSPSWLALLHHQWRHLP